MCFNFCHFDYIKNRRLTAPILLVFELLQEADVISNDYNYEMMSAFLEVRNWDDFTKLFTSVKVKAIAGFSAVAFRLFIFFRVVDEHNEGNLRCNIRTTNICRVFC